MTPFTYAGVSSSTDATSVIACSLTHPRSCCTIQSAGSRPAILVGYLVSNAASSSFRFPTKTGAYDSVWALIYRSRLHSRSRSPSSSRSSVDLSHHDVDRCVDGDDVGEEVPFDHLRDRRKVHEARRADAPACGFRRAVGNEVVAFLTLRALNRDVA